MKTTRRLIQICILGVVLTVLPPLVKAQSFLTNGLVAYYTFNGNANDNSGNGNNGTAFNGVSYVSSPLGSAASFNGNSQYISLPNAITVNEDLSVTFWINTSDFNPNGFPFGEFLISRDISGYAFDWNICLGQGRKIDFITDADELMPTHDMDSNTWVQVACVADSVNQAKMIFVNGQAAASVSWQPNAFANNGVPVFLGASTVDTGSHAFFTGGMTDVRIYNRALSASEVATLYAVESGFCSPHAAEATAIVTNGFVVEATITDNGCGYTNPPVVLIQNGGGSNATATATIQNGFVTSINIINPGSGYTNLPDILIGSPPFVPTLTINVSRVNVTQHVVLGFKYVLESSPDMINWTATGPQFTAQSEEITTEFVVNQTGQFFRIRQVP
jgi:hypothetical protein